MTDIGPFREFSECIHIPIPTITAGMKSHSHSGMEMEMECSFSSPKSEFYEWIRLPNSVIFYPRFFWDLKWLLSARACEGRLQPLGIFKWIYFKAPFRESHDCSSYLFCRCLLLPFRKSCMRNVCPRKVSFAGCTFLRFSMD